MSQELWYTTKCVFIYTCKKITNFPTTIFHENNKYLFILYMDSFEVDNKYGKLVQIFIKSSPITGQGWPRGFQQVKVPRFHDNGTGWW